MAKPKQDDLRERIEQYKGNVSAIARHYGVVRSTVHRWINGTATARQSLEDARETMLDEAESVLYRKVLEGSTPELIFFLKTQGKARGYIERNEHTGPDGEALRIVIDK